VLLQAKATARTIDAEAMREPDDERRKKIRAWATKSESRAGLENMVALARSECGASPADFDADPWSLNVANGTIDLRTGELRAHRGEDLISKLAPVDFDPEATAPTWIAFLDRAMAGNAGMIEHLQRLIGYALVGLPCEHILAFSYGGGANGKSVFHNAIATMLGDYGVKAPRGLLYESRNDRHPAELVTLFGARFVLCPETKAGQRFDEGLVKDLVSDEPIQARGMHENFWPFMPSHTLFLAGNAKPTISGTDDGIWRRMVLIPWDVQIPKGERDLTLASKLAAEQPGILAWAILGCLAWQREGLGRPPEVERATDAYRQESNPLAGFLSDRCVIEPEAKVVRSALRMSYESWCVENGAHPVGPAKLAEGLRARGIVDGPMTRTAHDRTPVRSWLGVRLAA
jgi:putative DNA primase/helicase